jgi:ABC-type transport system involved in multi-copper enzyme maturation permease subunit
MLWTIVKKQVLVNVLSYRFVVGFALCQVLFVLATVILVRDYEERVSAHGEAVSRNARQLQEVKVFSQLSLNLSKAPSRLSPLCTGFDKKFGNQVTVSSLQIPQLSAGRQEKNPLLAALHSIDLVGVIQMVLGLLVLLFAHDTVSGERERGTLALSLSSSVPRHKFLFGQYLGGMITIVTVFLVGIALALLLIIRSPAIQFTSGEWLKLSLLILLSVAYVSALYLLGMLVSTVANRSVTALVVLLFFWILFVAVFPNLTTSLAARLKPIPARGTVSQEASVLMNEFWRGAYEHSQAHLPRPDHDFDLIKGRYVHSGSLPYPITLYYAPREIMEWELAGVKEYVPRHIRTVERIHDLHRDYERRLEEQSRLARNLSRISPAWVYYHAATSLAGTDADSYLRFLERSRKYRRELIRYAESKDGLYSHRYFTRLEPSRWRGRAELEALKGQPGRLEQEMGPGWEAVDPLNLADLPPFDSSGPGVHDAVGSALPDIALLVFLNLVLFLGAHVCFLRADVRPCA